MSCVQGGELDRFHLFSVAVFAKTIRGAEKIPWVDIFSEEAF